MVSVAAGVMSFEKDSLRFSRPEVGVPQVDTEPRGSVAESILVEESRVAPLADKCDTDGVPYFRFASSVATQQVVDKPALAA
jgi:hypothetical protein